MRSGRPPLIDDTVHPQSDPRPPEPVLPRPDPNPAAEAPASPAPQPVPSSCANCGAGLHGRFCARCGQDSEDRGTDFRRFAVASAAEVMNLDGRIARTLRALLNPGALTEAWLAGRRVAYVPPFKLAFSCSLVLLLAVALRLPRGAAVTGATNLVDDIGAVAGHQAATLALLVLALLPLLASVTKRVCGGWESPYMAGLVLLLHEHALGTLAVAAAVALSFRTGREGAVYLLLAATALTAVHLLFAIRRTYRASRPRTVLSWMVVVAGYLAVVAFSFTVVAVVRMIAGG